MTDELSEIAAHAVAWTVTQAPSVASHKLKMLAKGIYGLQRDDLDDHGRSPIRVK